MHRYCGSRTPTLRCLRRRSAARTEAASCRASHRSRAPARPPDVGLRRAAASATPRSGCRPKKVDPLGRNGRRHADLLIGTMYVWHTLLYVRRTCQGAMSRLREERKVELRMRARFTTDEIAAAALRIVDESGVGALSMRSLAAALDTGPMTLYNYVADKEGLEELVVAAIVDRGAAARADRRLAAGRVRHRPRDVARRARTSGRHSVGADPPYVLGDRFRRGRRPGRRARPRRHRRSRPAVRLPRHPRPGHRRGTGRTRRPADRARRRGRGTDRRRGRHRVPRTSRRCPRSRL